MAAGGDPSWRGPPTSTRCRVFVPQTGKVDTNPRPTPTASRCPRTPHAPSSSIWTTPLSRRAAGRARKPELGAPEEQSRSTNSTSVISRSAMSRCPEALRGDVPRRSLSAASNGMRHLRSLAEAGPHDRAPAAGQRHRDVEEDRSRQRRLPATCLLPARLADQQACVSTVAGPTASTGATTRCITRRPRARTPPIPTGRRARRSSGRWSRGSTAPACAWSWTWSTTTRPRPGRTRSRSSTASCPATTSG